MSGWHPAWESGTGGVAAHDTAILFIEPGLGFGTGLHETTQMCLATLAARRRRTAQLDRALDVGGCSVIVVIAAAVLLEHAALLCRHVSRTDGELIRSGLRADDLPAVEARFTALLGVQPSIQERGDWRCLIFRRV